MIPSNALACRIDIQCRVLPTTCLAILYTDEITDILNYMLDKFLQEIGLSEKEASIYLHLLKVDQDSVADIAKATKVNRTTVYPVLQQLMEKEFVIENHEGGKTFYRARTPDRIESFLQEQKLKIEEQTKVAKDMIPQLKGIAREEGQRPIIEYFEGRDAIMKASKNYYTDADEGGDVYLIYPRDEVEALFSEKERQLARELRLKKNIRSKSIYTYKNGEYNPDNTGDRFKVDEKEFPINSDISVYGDRVRIHILGEKLGTVYIKSKDVAETIRTLFKLAIKGLQK